MKTSICALVLCCIATAANAAGPASFSYQGYLTDASGSPTEAPATLPITFSLYTVASGGVPIWFDDQAVDVNQGLFSVTLGSVDNPFPAGIFESPLFLGIAVDGDVEMTPRRPITAVAFSIKAEDASTLQGQSPSAFDQAAHVVDGANPHGITAAQTGAATSAELANLQAQLDAALLTIAQLQSDLAAETTARISGDAAEASARAAAIAAEAAARVASDEAQDTTIAEIGANTVLTLDGVLTRANTQTALFTGVNVQIVNGSGTTDGDPDGTGNLIVGYNVADSDAPQCSLGVWFDDEASCLANGEVWAASHQSGSHNVVIGDQHNYSRFGGLVVGLDNNITGNWSSVSGGIGSTASSNSSSVSGGAFNISSAPYSSISGGQNNRVAQFYASISGGLDNLATGLNASICGGRQNTSSGGVSSISGGWLNTASANFSSVSGGQSNVASAVFASVSGGSGNEAAGPYSSIGGGISNSAYGQNSAILGGELNVTGDAADTDSGLYATISGGGENNSRGSRSSVSGGLRNSADNSWTSISGGGDNTASASQSSVSGGVNNTASGFQSSVAGGDNLTCAADACGEGAFDPPD